MLSTADQALAVALVGETPDGTLAAQVVAIAGQYSFDAMYPGFGLELLYVERDLLKVAHGWAWKQVEQSSPSTKMSLQQQAQALAVRLKDMTDQIATRLAQAQSSVPGVSTGCISTTAPTAPPWPAPSPDANDVRYAGSPYYPQIRPQN